MRTLAIGDIHGCHTALTCLLQQVQPHKEDKVIFLGDYIDRGPDSRAVVDSLIKLKTRCSPIFLRGNHEVMLLDAREDTLKEHNWGSYGGFETLISYQAEQSLDWAPLIPRSHWKFFEQTTRYHETSSHIFVHACLDPELQMDDQPDWLLFWEHVDRLKPHRSGKQVICGHSPQRTGEILNLGFALCIDTAAVRGGWLTCLDVESGQWWQTNENGLERQGVIPSRC